MQQYLITSIDSKTLRVKTASCRADMNVETRAKTANLLRGNESQSNIPQILEFQ